MNPQPPSFQDDAKSYAASLGLDPALVCAVIEQESAWNPNAVRYEALFRAKYVAPQHLAMEEELFRSFSWGVMQVMGQTAREHGYNGFLPSLCDPHVGLVIGCKVLLVKLGMAEGDVAKGLLYWNGGANILYPQQVMARMAKYQ